MYQTYGRKEILNIFNVFQETDNSGEKEEAKQKLAAYVEEFVSTNNATGALYELFKLKRVQPLFELAQICWSDNRITIFFVVSYGNIDAIGRGRTEKEAKNSAAYNLLRVMFGFRERDDDLLPIEDKQDYYRFSVEALSRFCRQRKIAYPIYLELSDSGYANHHIVCCLGKYRSNGKGRNKKLAKRLAAKRMLIKIRRLSL